MRPTAPPSRPRPKRRHRQRRPTPIPWRRLEDRTKDALRKSPGGRALAAYQKRGKECKGALSGEVTRACEQADTALSNAVVAEIRGGLTLPVPEHLP